MTNYDDRLNECCAESVVAAKDAVYVLANKMNISLNDAMVILAGTAITMVAIQRGGAFAHELSDASISDGVRERDVLLENRP